MTDVHNKETRSYNMSRVKSKDTKPELLVRRFLHQQGFRFKLHDMSLPGKPDLVLPRHKVVIFIHGCFWHGHKGCKYFTVPQTRTKWWLDKIEGNAQNDVKAVKVLKNGGWKVVIIWGCQLKRTKIKATLGKLLRVFT
jgi:DNA mismatch endonuclease, patch repair protein